MKTVNIIVEGQKDVYFIHEFLLQRFPVFKRAGNPIPKNRLKNNVVDMRSSDGSLVIHLIGISGFSQIEKLPNLMHQKPDEEGSFAFGVVFDADYASKESFGGFNARQSYLISILMRQNPSKADLSNSLFLFPNNKDDGDLEVLMERMIAHSPEHDDFLSICWKSFSECVKRHGFNLTSQKSKMNEYMAAFYDGTWDDNGINRGLAESSLWDWNSHYLDELYTFISHLLTMT